MLKSVDVISDREHNVMLGFIGIFTLCDKIKKVEVLLVGNTNSIMNMSYMFSECSLI